MKKYRVGGWGTTTKIDELEISKESDHSIWITGGEYTHVERKNTVENKHFDTWQEAYDYLLNSMTNQRDNFRRRLADAEHDLTTVLNLKP